MLVKAYARIRSFVHRLVCIMFLPNPPIAILELHNCLSHDEGPHFCIHQNKNIDDDLYCNSNEFPNFLLAPVNCG